MFEIATIPLKNRTIEERTCNQCGKCCQDVMLNISPAEMEQVKNGTHPKLVTPENQKVAAMLIFTKEEKVRIWNKDTGEQKYHYSCTNFILHEDGKGHCGIYDTRPIMCIWFPFSNGWQKTEERQKKYLESYPFPSQYQGCSYNINDNKPYWDDPLK